MNCKICNTSLKKFLDLGRQPIANNFLSPDQFDNEYFYHLEVFFCPECYSVQIGECPPPSMVFNEKYPFFSSTSILMKQHFKELAELIIAFYLPIKGFIVEIGSNDGTFLENFKHLYSFRASYLGIEPSESVADIAFERGINTWNIFFNEECAEKIINFKRKADVIVSTNVFPHILYRHSVLKGIKKLLVPSGVWINEEAYLGDTIKKVTYDQFYNEHIFYATVSSYEKMMKLFDLEIVDIEFLNVHGGSIRFYIKHISKGVPNQKVTDIIKEENLSTFDVFESFEKKVKYSKDYLLSILSDLKKNKKEIVGYAATAKSSTITNYCKIDKSMVSKIYDTTPIKHWLYSPGMHIPIVPYDYFERDKAKDIVLFAWNHATEIFEREKGKGINWILPV